MKKWQCMLLFCWLAGQLSAQKLPNSILFQGAIIHTPTGIIQNGVLGIRGDSIILVGDMTRIRIDRTAYEQIVDVGGKHIFPGFIALNSSIGLREIDAVRATIDVAEVGTLNPHVRSLTAYNTDSRIIPTVRSNGILTIQSCPQGGLVSGSSSVFRSAGWNWEDAVRYVDDGMHVNWPSAPLHLSPSDTGSRNNRYLKQHAQLLELFREAKAYAASSELSNKNLRLEALRGVFTGKSALYLHADNARDISDAVAFAASFNIPRIVIVGGIESDQVIPLLKEKSVAVILSRLHRLPDLPDQLPRDVFTLPARLHQAGILVALSYDGDMDAMGTRNLGFTAGTAAAYGISSVDALSLITLHPAKILGIDKKEGSLELGKKASFFIADGNALDMMHSSVNQVYIDGKMVDVDTFQKELYQKYMKKFGLN